MPASRKPLHFFALFSLFALADMLLVRPAGWPEPLLSRQRLALLLAPETSGTPEAVAPDEAQATVLTDKTSSDPAPLPVDATVCLAPGPATFPAPLVVAMDEGPFVRPEDPGWNALSAKLAERAAGKPGVIRVLHIGDSEIANDQVARTLRQRFVERFGDAGPGFALALAPWNWYERESFAVPTENGFSSRSVALVKSGDGNFGPGGVAFDARRSRAVAEISVDTRGHDHCEVALLYGLQPEGAELEILVDGKPVERLSTRAEALAVGRKDLQLASCPRKLAVRALGTPARVFGWSVEWGTSGVVWSSLGVVGVSAAHFLRYGPGQLAEAIRALQPDLVVVAHGLNVANHPTPPPDEERQGLERILQELRPSLPDSACLVMSPYPIAYSNGDRVSPSPSTSTLAGIQRAVAEHHGCAFLDRQLMAGGPKTAVRWLHSRPRLLSGDYVHLTDRGAEKVGGDVAQMLLARLGAAL